MISVPTHAYGDSLELIILNRPKLDSLNKHSMPPSEQHVPRSPKRRSKGDLKHEPKTADDWNDTPRAFQRLMNFKRGIRPSPGLDDGKSSKTKQKPVRQSRTAGEGALQNYQVEIPTIRPGERMIDFSARVDAALPVGGLIRKERGNIAGIKKRQTRTERKLLRMQQEWREADAKRKEKLQDMEEDQLPFQTPTKRTKKSGKQDRTEPKDIWANVGKGRPSSVSSGLVGLHDVVEAPPQLHVAKKDKPRSERDGHNLTSDVPNAAGSLRRRELLGEERNSIIETYRNLMGH